MGNFAKNLNLGKRVLQVTLVVWGLQSIFETLVVPALTVWHILGIWKKKEDLLMSSVIRLMSDNPIEVRISKLQ